MVPQTCTKVNADMEEQHERTGGCLCGAVRYVVRGPLRDIIWCHCGQCRRQTGSALAASATRRANFHLQSAETLRWFASSANARRGFCSQCGSVLFWECDGAAHIAIAAGSLDDGRGIRISGHIYAAHKAPWEEIVPSGVPVEPGDYSFPAP